MESARPPPADGSGRVEEAPGPALDTVCEDPGVVAAAGWTLLVSAPGAGWGEAGAAASAVDSIRKGFAPHRTVPTVRTCQWPWGKLHSPGSEESRKKSSRKSSGSTG